LHDAVSVLLEKGLIKESPILDSIAAVSVGMGAEGAMLDLDYVEDSSCETDMNVVMTGAGTFVEIQGTAEGVPFSRADMDLLVELAGKGIAELIGEQGKALG
jgi:ribonuclease PH